MAIYWTVIGSKIHKLSIYQKVDRGPPSRGPNRKHWRLVLNFNLNFCRDVEHCMAQFTAEFSSFGESASLFHYLGVSPPSLSRRPKRSHEPYQKSDSAFPCIVVIYHLHGCPNIGGKSCAVGHSSNLPFLPTVWTITPLLFAKKKCTYGFAMQLKRSSGSCKCSGPFPEIWAPCEKCKLGP